jgi:hypothetical protein
MHIVNDVELSEIYAVVREFHDAERSSHGSSNTVADLCAYTLLSVTYSTDYRRLLLM